jgi:hypothetical protein
MKEEKIPTDENPTIKPKQQKPQQRKKRIQTETTTTRVCVARVSSVRAYIITFVVFEKNFLSTQRFLFFFLELENG